MLSLQEAREMKQQEAGKGMPEQMDSAEDDLTGGKEEEEEICQEGKETPAEATEGAAEGQPEPSINQAEEYKDPQPENITSLCYSCENYETCHEKRSTVTSCNIYINREEARKTDEQRYNEQQAEIDRETAKKLKERQQEEKMQQFPSEEEKEAHNLTISPTRFEEITSGELPFLLLKKDGYKVGEEIGLMELKEGKETGRKVSIRVTYIWKDWTGLDDDYCIIGFRVMPFDA